MTFQLVTLEHAKIRLRIDIPDHDADVQLMIDQASDIVMDYLKLYSLPDLWHDASGSPSGTGVPPLVQAAVHAIIGELDINRAASLQSLLSPAVCSLLARYRDPALA